MSWPVDEGQAASSFAPRPPQHLPIFDPRSPTLFETLRTPLFIISMHGCGSSFLYARGANSKCPMRAYPETNARGHHLPTHATESVVVVRVRVVEREVLLCAWGTWGRRRCHRKRRHGGRERRDLAPAPAPGKTPPRALGRAALPHRPRALRGPLLVSRRALPPPPAGPGAAARRRAFFRRPWGHGGGGVFGIARGGARGSSARGSGSAAAAAADRAAAAADVAARRDAFLVVWLLLPLLLLQLIKTLAVCVEEHEGLDPEISQPQQLLLVRKMRRQEARTCAVGVRGREGKPRGR